MKRILFVDDEPNVLDGLKRMLRPQRDVWHMTFAGDGPAALDLLAAEQYDVIVSDMRMPGMDGATLLGMVCEKHPSVVRIILSGYTELGASVRAVPVAHRFLFKPCDLPELRQALDRDMGIADRFNCPPVAELVGSLRALPTAPSAYEALRDTVSADQSSIDGLAEIIARDVGISARILQLANSAFFGQRPKVADIKTAVAYLGPDILRHLLLTVEIFRRFEPATPIPGFGIDSFQRHCHLTSAIAERLPVPGVPAHTLRMAGLLHDVGKLVLADRNSDRFGRAQAISQSEGRPAVVVEAELFGLSHAEIGAYLLSLWGLPDAVVEAVANHHHPERADDDSRDVSRAIYLANRLAHLHDNTGDACGDLGRETMDQEVFAALGGEQMLSAWQAMAAEVAEAFPAPPLPGERSSNCP